MSEEVVQDGAAEAGKGKPTGWIDLLIGMPIIWGIDMALGVFLVAFLLISGGDPTRTEDHPILLTALSLLSALGTLAVTAALVCWKNGRGFLEGFRLVPISRKALGVSVLFGAGYALLAGFIFGRFSTKNSLFEKMAATPEGLVCVSLLALALPFIEEIYYHGFIFPVLRHSWGGVWAVVAVTFWFSLAHVMQLLADPVGIPIIAVALAFWTVQRHLTDSLTAPLVSHFTYNACLVAMTLGARLSGEGTP